MQVFYCFFLFVNLVLCQQSNDPPFKIAITADSPTVVAEGDVWIKEPISKPGDVKCCTNKELEVYVRTARWDTLLGRVLLGIIR
jgi:hypothetical protein